MFLVLFKTKLFDGYKNKLWKLIFILKFIIRTKSSPNN